MSTTYMKDVQRALASRAIERSPSTLDYLDSRLATILSAASAVALIREVLQDREMLEVIARRSYTHSNGFDKITLISNQEPEFKLRLHAWWAKEGAVTTREFIHNHRWFFTSSPLRGASFMEIFEENDRGKSAYRYEYAPRDDALERYHLERDGMSKLISSLSLKLAPGSIYSMGPDALHRILWVGDTPVITLFVRWGSIRRGATVFSEVDLTDQKLLSVPSFTPKQTRAKLERIMAELSEIPISAGIDDPRACQAAVSHRSHWRTGDLDAGSGFVDGDGLAGIRKFQEPSSSSGSTTLH